MLFRGVDQAVVGGVGAAQLNGWAHAVPRGRPRSPPSGDAEVLAAGKSCINLPETPPNARELKRTRCGGGGPVAQRTRLARKSWQPSSASVRTILYCFI